MIYGLLALMDESLASLIKPDYTDTVENIYRSFIFDTIKATGSLDIIRHCEPEKNSSFPSWIPELLIKSDKSTLTINDNAFATSGLFLASVQALTDLKSISRKGIIVDCFDCMGCRWTGVPSRTFVRRSGSQWWRAHRLPSEPLVDDYSSLLATPVLATAVLPENSPIKDIVGSNVFDWRMEEYFWKDLEPEKIDAVHLRDALMQRDRVNLGMRLVTTERGHVGMALETVERTDVVAVLLGCSTPMVLRPVQGDAGYLKWKVVGECYLHGIMNGEAMGWGLETEDIVLCQWFSRQGQLIYSASRLKIVYDFREF
ncbi:hypothetical protein MMC29_004856 [Sticta canariensis]|nr:hypothetical protein [Sticta canariensis]